MKHARIVNKIKCECCELHIPSREINRIKMASGHVLYCDACLQYMNDLDTQPANIYNPAEEQAAIHDFLATQNIRIERTI